MFWMLFFAVFCFLAGLILRGLSRTLADVAYIKGDDVYKQNKPFIVSLKPILPGLYSAAWIRQRLNQARISKYTPEGIITLSYVTLLIFALMAAAIGLTLFKDASVTLPFMVCGGALGAIYPALYLDNEAKKADERRKREMLPFVQQLKILAKSGFGSSFKALASVALEDSRGLIAEDFRDALHDIERGKGRREALLGMVDKTNSPLVKEVVDLILDAEEKELPLYNVLEGIESRLIAEIETKADEMRAKDEDAMALPLAGLLLPAIMIIILAPGLINIRIILRF